MRRRGGPPADRYFYRPDLDPANAGYPGSWVYLVCLDPPIAHPEAGPHASCSHYTGQSWDLPARQAAHGTSEGARLLAVPARPGRHVAHRPHVEGRPLGGARDQGLAQRPAAVPRPLAREPARPARRRRPRRGAGPPGVGTQVRHPQRRARAGCAAAPPASPATC